MFPRIASPSHGRFVALRNLVASGLLLGLSACSPGTVNYVHVDTSYDPTTYAHIPYTGPLFAEVAGNPFGIPQPDLQRIVNAAIQPPNARSDSGQGVRVHIAFGETASNRSMACFAGGTNAPSTGTITMVAALCRGGDAAITYLVGSVDQVTGPNDPRFLQFLRRSTVLLFPTQDPNRDTNTMCFLPGC
ncbi:MAG TPA: hypothetical protein VMW18_01680 [Candidatus Binatia bacterium]|nr:hypothetical protein [Candidatus Binatia bacterium]